MGEALGQPELLLLALARRQVGEEDEEPQQLAARAAERCRREPDPMGLAADQHVALLALQRLPAGDGVEQQRSQLGLRFEELAHVRTRGWRRTEQRRAGRVERQHAPLAIEEQEPALEAGRQGALERSELLALLAAGAERALEGSEQEGALVLHRRRVELP